MMIGIGPIAICLTLLVFFPSAVLAHYLWLVIDSRTGSHGSANVIFEESAAPGDGR